MLNMNKKRKVVSLLWKSNAILKNPQIVPKLEKFMQNNKKKWIL